MMLRDVYVFVNIDGVEVPAARLQHWRESAGDRFYFRYGKRYLDRPDAFSIDPRQLPLSDKVSVHESLPLAIQDNGPDDFGRYLYEVLHGAPPESPIDYHLDNGLAGVGALALSRTLDAPSDSLLLKLDSLEELVEAFEALEARRPLSPRMSVLLGQGSNLPGARPKARHVEVDGDEWIVKFERPDDVFNVPIAEHATMLHAQPFMRVAHTKVIQCASHQVFLVKRFDREPSDIRRHFLSAYTLMGANRVTPERFFTDFGYAALAQLTKQISPSPEQDRKELYRRLLFNAIVGNRDDHLKNHGFIKERHSHHYRLSPAYDLVPGGSSLVHAIGVGASGATASLSNLLSQSVIFGYSQDESLQLLGEIDAVVPQILATARDCGMTQRELTTLEDRMMRFDGAELRVGATRAKLSSTLDFESLSLDDIHNALASSPSPSHSRTPSR